MNKKELKVQLEHGNITREEYQRELDILEGKPNKKDSKEDKTAIHSSELKGNFQIGLGKFVTTISIILAVFLLVVGLDEVDSYSDSSRARGYLLIQCSIGMLFFGGFFGVILTSIGRLVFYSSVRTNIEVRLAEEKGIKLVD
jgi:hypothetical protein